jgi:cleavage and polyadenylation specificity factor subunit 3
MTHPTKAIYKWLLSDYVKVSNVSSEEMLYTEHDLQKSFEKIEAVDYHQEVEIDGIKVTSYNAGHVLGAAMFLIEIAGVKVLYTGDYSREEDRHLKAAEKPDTKLDVLICESTYGVQCHQSRIEREHRFTSLVREIVTRGGRCLIPVFALGRAQELLLILDEYWQAHPELHKIPIYYASSLAKKCMAVYQTYINMMNERIRRQISINNPFIFKHISNLKSIDHFDDVGPCVMMASPGMLQNGLSRELFELWCPNKNNGVIIPGYCVEGTLAKHILSDPQEISALSGAIIPLRMSVSYISFSAHVDFAQNSQFIDLVNAPNLILVHGDSNEMSRLKGALAHKYDEIKDRIQNIFTPRNCEKVELEFRGEKIAKIIGAAAKSTLSGEDVGQSIESGRLISGILVGKDFEYQIMDANDLKEYSHLNRASILQRQMVKCHASLSLIEYHLVQLFGRSQVQRAKNSILLYDSIQIEVQEDAWSVSIEWAGNFVNDMIVDSLLAVLMNVATSKASVKSKQFSSNSDAEGRRPFQVP